MGGGKISANPLNTRVRTGKDTENGTLKEIYLTIFQKMVLKKNMFKMNGLKNSTNN